MLYSFLLVMTPFVLLQNFLVDLISHISGSRLPIGGLSLPIVPLVALLLVGIAFVRYRRQVTRSIVLSVIIIALMDALAQQMTDYYMGHRFFDLQQNWHYIAYGLFAFMAYRDFVPRGYSLAKIIWVTFVCALCFSAFDETFQMRMSSRVFDLSDTAKDILGVTMGLVLIAVGGRPGEMRDGWRSAMQMQREKHAAGVAGAARAIFRNPTVSLALIAGICVIMLACASLLSDFAYVAQAIGLTALFSALLFVAVVLFLQPWGKFVVPGVLVVMVGGLAVSHAIHRNDGITQHRYGFTVYRGVPIPYFDAMIFPDGNFRLVDKKHYFNPRDQQFLCDKGADIILIGTGERDLGGKGFPEDSTVQFVFNSVLNRASQVIILTSAEACRLHSRLRQEGKRVLFVLHNTC